MFVLAAISLLLASQQAFAVPFPGGGSPPSGTKATRSCNISGAVMPVPPGQTAIVQPSTPPSFIGLGVGTQNYTCSNAGTYTSAGALAELVDISCLVDQPVFSNIADLAYDVWSKAPASISASQIISFLSMIHAPYVLGQHYFIPNPVTGTGLSPKWDFTSASFAGNPNAFVVGAKTGGVPAPTGSGDVDWLSLNGIQGNLATQIFRVATKGGPAPASCTPGSAPITVKYTSQYWLFGSTVSH